MKLFKCAAMLSICCGCQAQSTAAIQSRPEPVYRYELVTPESKNWNTELHPDLPSVKKEDLCPVILKSFQNMADTKSDICERSFDTSIGFGNINWSELPNSAISNRLIEEVARSKIPNPRPFNWTDDIENQRFQLYVKSYRDVLSSDRNIVSQSSFDLDNDGIEDLVYRLKAKECDETKIDGSQQTKPIEPYYIFVNEDGSLKHVLANGPVPRHGILFRYSGRTFISQSGTYYTEGGGRHIAIHSISPRSGGSSPYVGSSALCIIEESR